MVSNAVSYIRYDKQGIKHDIMVSMLFICLPSPFPLYPISAHGCESCHCYIKGIPLQLYPIHFQIIIGQEVEGGNGLVTLLWTKLGMLKCYIIWSTLTAIPHLSSNYYRSRSRGKKALVFTAFGKTWNVLMLY